MTTTFRTALFVSAVSALSAASLPANAQSSGSSSSGMMGGGEGRGMGWGMGGFGVLVLAWASWVLLSLQSVAEIHDLNFDEPSQGRIQRAAFFGIRQKVREYFSQPLSDG